MHPPHDRDLRVDALTAVLAAVFLTTTTPLAISPDDLSWASYPLCALAGLAFAVRRARPLVTVWVVVLAVAAFLLANEDGGPIFVAAFGALANLGAVRPTTRGWLPAALASATILSAASVAAVGLSIHIVPMALLLLSAPRIAADRTRTRALRDEAVEQAAAARMAEERLRIAREVHDVVGHGLATIALRAGVADHVMTRDPEEAQQALRAIRQISRDSLSEISALLGVLRAEADHAPVPDLGHLPRLVQGVRDAGMAVELEVDGIDGHVPEVVGAAGYRIVQEALTNVARHAGRGARARVRLARRGDRVEVEVVDDGRGAPEGVRDGGGLTGMRERTAALGGTFEAGGAAGGGFRVHASLPAGTR